MDKLLMSNIRTASKLLNDAVLSTSNLINGSLARAQKNAQFNAFITLTSNKAKQLSTESDIRYKNKNKLSELDGIPIAIKDNFIPKYNATVYEKLLNAGAILIGKCNLDQFAMGSGTVDGIFGPTKNIWGYSKNSNDFYIAGGRSGGCAIAVASGICYAAIGLDTGGSTRNSASYCGLVGLKPTYGLVSRLGLIPLVNSMDVPGILTRTVDDCSMILNSIAGYDPKDSTSLNKKYQKIPIPDVTEINIKNLKIGIPIEYHCQNLSDEVLNTWREVALLLRENGANVQQVSMPHTECGVASNMARYDGIEFGYRSNQDKSTEELYASLRRQGFNVVVLNRILAGNYYSSNYDKYSNPALKVRRLISNDFDNVWEKVQILLTPTTLTTAPLYSEFISKTNRDQCAMQDFCTQPANMAELGSCSSLSILSLRGNRISQIPAEIGHLPSLRVLNIVDNRLRNLPMSLLKLDKLSALWLTTNQSQPLVPLQQEISAETYQTVLTCFMLPQLRHSSKKSIDYNHQDEHLPTISESGPDTILPTRRKHICFASDTGVTIEQPGRLARAPTPYPKELRALAKHAKNLQRTGGGTIPLQQQQQQEEKVLQSSIKGPIEIKEAKVTHTPQKKCNELDSSTSYSETKLHSSNLLNTDAFELVKETDTPRNNLSSQPVIAFESTPVIREAKTIRTDTQQPLVLVSEASESSSSMIKPDDDDDNDKVMNNSTPKPPPYHIAAAYSLQAQFFHSLDNNNIRNSSTSSTSTSNTCNDSCIHLNETHSLGSVSMMNQESNIMSTSSVSAADVDVDDLNQHVYKPQTFIQDKPLPGQNIIAPTPQRPSTADKVSSTKIPYLTSSPTMRRASGLRLRSNSRSRSPPQMQQLVSQVSPRCDRRSDILANLSNSNHHHQLEHHADANVNKKMQRTKIPAPQIIYSNSSCKASNSSSSISNVTDNNTSATKWVFGQHKNATVVQITLYKNPELGLGFSISENDGRGIFVESIQQGNSLKVGDKILEVEGIDFTKLSKEDAIKVLNNTGQSVSMMVSHIY